MTDCSLEPGEFTPLFENLVHRFGDDAFVVEMLSIFVADGNAAADRLTSAILRSDDSSIRNSLHSLKNILGTMQSGSLFMLAERTAEAFRNSNVAQARTDADELVSGTRRLVLAAGIFLGEFTKASPP